MDTLDKILKKLKLVEDIKRVMKVEKQIPRDGTIPENDAMVLHVLFLQAKMKMTDLLTKAKRYEVHIKIQRDNKLNLLMSKADEKSEAAKLRKAQGDTDWQTLQKERVNAEILVDWLANKRRDFGEASIMCRETLKFVREDKSQEQK